MIVIGCSHGVHVGKKIAKRAGACYSPLFVEKFPDGELHIRFRCKIHKEKVILVQSFYGDIDSCLIEVMFAAKTAKLLGAKSVTLAAPYFPYHRQDKMFSYGEVPSIYILGKIMSSIVDEILILDPHLHREKTLGHIFSIPSHRLTANPLIGKYIQNNIRNALLVGPDWESYKWAKKTADLIGAQSTILLKTRHSARKVEVRFQEEIDVRRKHIVLIDDIISTGHTLIKTIQALKKIGASTITCIAVHGVFAENALQKIQKAGARVVTSDSIPGKSAKIDISELFSVKLAR